MGDKVILTFGNAHLRSIMGCSANHTWDVNGRVIRKKEISLLFVFLVRFGFYYWRGSDVVFNSYGGENLGKEPLKRGRVRSNFPLDVVKRKEP